MDKITDDSRSSADRRPVPPLEIREATVRLALLFLGSGDRRRTAAKPERHPLPQKADGVA